MMNAQKQLEQVGVWLRLLHGGKDIQYLEKTNECDVDSLALNLQGGSIHAWRLNQLWNDKVEGFLKCEAVRVLESTSQESCFYYFSECFDDSKIFNFVNELQKLIPADITFKTRFFHIHPNTGEGEDRVYFEEVMSFDLRGIADQKKEMVCSTEIESSFKNSSHFRLNLQELDDFTELGLLLKNDELRPIFS